MAINIRQKGAGGEREVIDALQPYVWAVKKEYGIPFEYMKPDLQRNQNQSAVGGSDITNPFGLSIEVKRQEALSVGTWWKQCERSAQAANEVPVLLYRQNGKKWHCVMYAEAALPATNGSVATSMKVLCEIDWATFQFWFEQWVRRKLL